MNARAKKLAAVLGLGLSVSAQALTVTLTGTELAATHGVTFPWVQPVVNGSSLVFNEGPDLGGNVDKLVQVPLSAVGIGLTPADRKVSVAMSLTHLTDDFDPHIMMTDGATMVGVAISNDGNGSAFQALLVDKGTWGERQVSLVQFFSDAGFPAIGGSLTVTLEFDLQTLTNVTAGFGSKTGSFSTLGLTGAPSVVLTRDDDYQERVQLNWLRITGPAAAVVPVPAPLWLLATGFLTYLGLGASRRRQS